MVAQRGRARARAAGSFPDQCLPRGLSHGRAPIQVQAAPRHRREARQGKCTRCATLNPHTPRTGHHFGALGGRCARGCPLQEPTDADGKLQQLAAVAISILLYRRRRGALPRPSPIPRAPGVMRAVSFHLRRRYGSSIRFGSNHMHSLSTDMSLTCTSVSFLQSSYTGQTDCALLSLGSSGYPHPYAHALDPVHGRTGHART